VRRRRAPEVATPRVMTSTLSLFYVLGGTSGLLAVLGSAPDQPRRWAVVAIAVSAVLAGAALHRWGARCPRAFFHLPVAVASLLIALAAFLAPDPVTALAVGAIMMFVGVDAFFYFALLEGLAQLALAVGAVTVALLLRGGLPTTTVLALGVVVVAVGVVTGRLVARASVAGVDGLTGLANRRGFDEALQELLRPGVVLSAALLDLDHFKEINDTGGHAAGDEVLRRVARAWRRALPAGAVLARHGGDEFALLLPGRTGPEALALVDRLRGLHPDVGMSCGVAQHRPRDTAAQLMRRADQALYTAKAAGRGRAALATEPRESAQR
jgi:diguanylate cyclase (GGDEF)-like protein